MSDGALYRTKIHCYFLDQSRVVRPLPTEKNYHVFYQMMAGLGPQERKELGLAGYTVRDLRYQTVRIIYCLPHKNSFHQKLIS